MSSESTPTSIPRKVALVLGGGGAKGAYHVGVQKALSDRGYTRFTTIAGTSVGALNAVLFETASPSESREVWIRMADFAGRNKNWQKSVAAWAFLSAWALIPMAICAATLLPLFVILDDLQQPGFASRHYSVWPIVIGTHAMLLFSWSFNYGATMIIGHKDRVLGHLVKVPFGADLIKTLLIGLGVYTTMLQLFPSAPNLSFVGVRVVDIAIRSALLFVVWRLNSRFWRFYEGIGVRSYERAMNLALLDRTLLEDLIEERVQCLKRLDNGGAKLFANVSIFSVFHDPHSPRYESPNMPNFMGEDGGTVEAWSPSYIRLSGPNFSLVKNVLLDSASLPFAFPNIFKNKQSHCDGGVTDNLPIASIFLPEEVPDLLFVVPLRKIKIKSTETLFEDVDRMWARFIKARAAYPPTCNTTSARNAAYEQLFTNTKPSRHKQSIKICFIMPSKPLPTIPLPVLQFFTGTLNFNRSVLERWIEQGERDANASLDKFECDNPGFGLPKA